MHQRIRTWLRLSISESSPSLLLSSKPPFVLTYLRSDAWFDYTGGKTSQDIFNWFLPRTQDPVLKFQNCEEISSFVKDKVHEKDSLVVYFIGKDISEMEDEYIVFEKIAKVYTEMDSKTVFGKIYDAQCAKSHGLKDLPGVVMFRHFDDPKVRFMEPFSEINLMDFVLTNGVPPLIPYHDRVLHHIAGAKSASVILMLRADNYLNSDYFNVFQEASQKYKGKHVFMYAEPSDSHTFWQFNRYLGIYNETVDLPSLVILNPKAKGVDRYKYDGSVMELTSEKLSKFISDFH